MFPFVSVYDLQPNAPRYKLIISKGSERHPRSPQGTRQVPFAPVVTHRHDRHPILFCNQIGALRRSPGSCETLTLQPQPMKSSTVFSTGWVCPAFGFDCMYPVTFHCEQSIRTTLRHCRRALSVWDLSFICSSDGTRHPVLFSQFAVVVVDLRLQQGLNSIDFRLDGSLVGVVVDRRNQLSIQNVVAVADA